MRALVTGGAGYVGSVVVGALLDAGHEVSVFDDLSTGDRRAVPAGARFVEGDLLDRDALSAAFGDGSFGGFDAVLHFAALTSVAESVARPGRYYRNNVCGTLNLLDAMREAGVARLVFSSTAAVYGEPEENPVSETAATDPTNPYGDSKLAADRLIGAFARAHGLAATSLRYFNVAGAGGHARAPYTPKPQIIPIVLEAALGERERVEVFGTDYPTRDGTAVRDFIHVEDLGRAHLLALEAARPGEHRVYNLGNGAGFSVREVLEAAREVTGRPVEVAEAPRRPGDPATVVASSARARTELGWEPERPDLATIVADHWAWMQGHRGQRETDFASEVLVPVPAPASPPGAQREEIR